ncbi:unnamed protein product [Protopolystoma xenopodis]|uniref:Uncharacterized protein n=1 Tax=Protopolystoma xenopodis TaxID=117903 RepID=A0A3S5BVZ9_9PLAT|nr:unnamed protein product [Protopolystoma xenopodis]
MSKGLQSELNLPHRLKVDSAFIANTGLEVYRPFGASAVRRVSRSDELQIKLTPEAHVATVHLERDRPGPTEARPTNEGPAEVMLRPPTRTLHTSASLDDDFIHASYVLETAQVGRQLLFACLPFCACQQN